MRLNKIVSPRQATGQLSDSAGGRPSVNDYIVWIAVSNDNSGAAVKRKNSSADVVVEKCEYGAHGSESGFVSGF